MNGHQDTGQARPDHGAGLPPRNMAYRILVCGHPRIVAEGVPASTRLYCYDCSGVRGQAPVPLSPEHEHELAAARWRYAHDRLIRLREVTAALLEEAENDLGAAEAALRALEASPGIPLYTQPGGGGVIGRRVEGLCDDAPCPMVGIVIGTTADPEQVIVQWPADPAPGEPTAQAREPLDQLRPAGPPSPPRPAARLIEE